MADETTQDVATEVDPSTPIANSVVADEEAANAKDDKETDVSVPTGSLPEGAVIRS